MAAWAWSTSARSLALWLSRRMPLASLCSAMIHCVNQLCLCINLASQSRCRASPRALHTASEPRFSLLRRRRWPSAAKIRTSRGCSRSAFLGQKVQRWLHAAAAAASRAVLRPASLLSFVRLALLRACLAHGSCVRTRYRLWPQLSLPTAAANSRLASCRGVRQAAADRRRPPLAGSDSVAAGCARAR